MQPRTVALIVFILPILITNGVFLLSAYNGHIPWCIPYIEGCTTISQAARSGDSIFVFRAAMIAYAVLLMWFWFYARRWVENLFGQTRTAARALYWLGMAGAVALMVYIDFLGTEGSVNRFMRHYGIMLYFICTPLAQMILLKLQYDLLALLPAGTLSIRVLRYQVYLVVAMLFIGITHGLLDMTGYKTYENENITAWNIAMLLSFYFLGNYLLWKTYRCRLENRDTEG